MANVAPTSLVPETMLQRLAPRHEGFWLVAGQHSDHFTLAYVMDGGTHALTYHIYPCNTAEEVYDVCGHLMYDWTGAQDVIPARYTHNRPIGGRDTKSLELALRDREQDSHEQVQGAQNQGENNLNLNPIQNQVAMVQQGPMAAQPSNQMDPAQSGVPQNNSYHLAQDMAHEQHQPYLMNSAEPNENIDWSMNNESINDDIFNDVNPIINQYTDNAFAALSGDTAAFSSVLNQHSSTDDILFSKIDDQIQMDWTLFTST